MSICPAFQYTLTIHGRNLQPHKLPFFGVGRNYWPTKFSTYKVFGVNQWNRLWQPSTQHESVVSLDHLMHCFACFPRARARLENLQLHNKTITCFLSFLIHGHRPTHCALLPSNKEFLVCYVKQQFTKGFFNLCPYVCVLKACAMGLARWEWHAYPRQLEIVADVS